MYTGEKPKPKRGERSELPLGSVSGRKAFSGKSKSSREKRKMRNEKKVHRGKRKECVDRGSLGHCGGEREKQEDEATSREWEREEGEDKTSFRGAGEPARTLDTICVLPRQ